MSSGSATASASGEISGRALSKATEDKGRYAAAVFNVFGALQDPPLPRLDECTAEQLCNKTVWRRLAFFVTYTYKKKNGKYLSATTAESYVSLAMNQAARRLIGDDGDDVVVPLGNGGFKSAKDFFAVLGGWTSQIQQDNWYTQMNFGIRHAIQRREIEAGNELAGDAPSLSREALVGSTPRRRRACRWAWGLEAPSPAAHTRVHGGSARGR